MNLGKKLGPLKKPLKERNPQGYLDSLSPELKGLWKSDQDRRHAEEARSNMTSSEVATAELVAIWELIDEGKSNFDHLKPKEPNSSQSTTDERQLRGLPQPARQRALPPAEHHVMTSFNDTLAPPEEEQPESSQVAAEIPASRVFRNPWDVSYSAAAEPVFTGSPQMAPVPPPGVLVDAEGDWYNLSTSTTAEIARSQPFGNPIFTVPADGPLDPNEQVPEDSRPSSRR